MKQVGGVQKQKSTACTVQSLCSVCECVCVFVGGRIISVKQVGGVQKQKSTACTVQSLCVVCGVCMCVWEAGEEGGLFQWNRWEGFRNKRAQPALSSH